MLKHTFIRFNYSFKMVIISYYEKLRMKMLIYFLKIKILIINFDIFMEYNHLFIIEMF